MIYFSPLVKSQTDDIPKEKNNKQFLPLHQLEDQGTNARIRMFSCQNFSSVISKGIFHLAEEVLQKRPAATDIAVIMYTSGSTGTPKGEFDSKDHCIDLYDIDRRRQ